MMASSPRAVLAGQRNDKTRVFVFIISIILLDLSVSVESVISGVSESLTARLGDTVNIPFEYCGLPKPSCTLTQNFNLSAPNPTCTVDRYGHCEVAPGLVGDDPLREAIRESLGSCELCVLVIHGVTQKDAGRYAMCQTSGACTSSFWSTISTLIVEEKETAPLTTEAVESTPKLSAKYTEKVGNNNALIFGVRERLTTRVGYTVNIPFEYCGLPRPSCTLAHSFRLAAPNSACTLDRYGHCEVSRAPDNDPFREGMDNVCELCVLVVHEVTERDAGPYAICQTSGSCTSSFWRKISTLEVDLFTEEKETVSLTTEAVEPIPMLSTKYTEKVGSNDEVDDDLNDKREHPARNIALTVVGVFIAVIIVVGVIWAIRRVRKLRKISKFHDHERYQSAQPMDPSHHVVGNGFAVLGDPDDDATGKTRLYSMSV